MKKKRSYVRRNPIGALMNGPDQFITNAGNAALLIGHLPQTSKVTFVVPSGGLVWKRGRGRPASTGITIQAEAPAQAQARRGRKSKNLTSSAT
jgi:hypothetical protein